ncbi:MAG TPA: hydroxymethylbilane synthase, partial [Roseivirga sp.]
NETIQMKGGIISMDGKIRIVKEASGSVEQAQQLGSKLANDVLSSGGKEILEEIKRILKQ